MIKIAILASGSGSNALALIEYFRERKDVEINFVISNKRKSGVITHAAVNDIDHYIIDKEIFYESSLIDIKMKSRKIDLIVLAGAAAIENSAKQAGTQVTVPFVPGRADAAKGKLMLNRLIT